MSSSSCGAAETLAGIARPVEHQEGHQAKIQRLEAQIEILRSQVNRSGALRRLTSDPDEIEDELAT
jgi:hypothetical protein